MKLTTARLLELAELGLSDVALRVYLTALVRMAETGSASLTLAALNNLPGLPRQKALEKTIGELVGKGLAGDDPDGFIHFVALGADVSSKRAAAGRLGGLAKASKRLASASGVPPSLPGVLPEQMPAGCQPDATDPPSPPAPPLPLSLDPQSGSLAVFPADSSALSSGSEPESKRARGAKAGRRERFVPESWSPKESHRTLAEELRVPLATELSKFREHEFKDPKQDFDRAFSRWLRRAAEFQQSSSARVVGGGSSVPMLMARIQRMEAEGEGN